MKDPLYNIDCSISDELPDETYYFRLHEKTYLSYSLHKRLLNNERLYSAIKRINDAYHENPNNRDFLVFCDDATLFTNENKHYIFLNETEECQ